MRIPWWLRPFTQYKALLRKHTAHLNKCAALIQAEQDEIRRLDLQVTSLQRELAAAHALPGGMPSTATPEFIFIGIPRPDGSKRLWASKDLAGTAFTMTDDMAGGAKWKIGAIMANSLTTDGDSYGECIEKVLTIWANWLSTAQRLAPPPQTSISERTGPPFKLDPVVRGSIQHIYDQATEPAPWSQTDADVKGDIQAAMHQAELDGEGPFPAIEAPDKEKK